MVMYRFKEKEQNTRCFKRLEYEHFGSPCKALDKSKTCLNSGKTGTWLKIAKFNRLAKSAKQGHRTVSFQYTCMRMRIISTKVGKAIVAHDAAYGIARRVDADLVFFQESNKKESGVVNRWWIRR